MNAIKRFVEEHKQLIISTRRDLHRIPETADTEEKSSQYLAEQLQKLGLPVHTGVARAK